MHKVQFIFIIAALTCVSVAQESGKNAASSAPAAQAPSKPEPWFSQRYPRYEIRPGDSFDVSFEYTPEYNQTVSVQPDGYVSMRSIGDVYVAGKTVPEVADLLRSGYGKILNKPAISITLKDFEKPYFVADGQVGHPGKYDLRDDTTVTQALAMAGGLLPSAKHSQVVLYRRISDQWMKGTVINVKAMQKKHDLSEDAHLQPGDMLFVPKNGFSKVLPVIPTANISMIPVARP